MKSLFTIILLLAGFLPTLVAQDIHPAPLVWINCDDNPDELPVAKGGSKMEIPDDLKKVHEPVYAELRLHITDKGKATAWDIGTTSPWLPRDLLAHTDIYVPAKRQGKSVACEVALELIYNPAEADPKSPDAIPRLLALFPPLYPEKANPADQKDRVVRVKATINEKGLVTACKAAAGEPAGFAEAAAGAVRNWQFAPARKGGVSVTADLELNVVFQYPLCRKEGVQKVMPKVLERITPNYPSYLKQAGFQGEVELNFTINVEGRVSEVFATKSSHPGFEDAAIASLKQWRFVPAQIAGTPVSTRCAQVMQFNLGDATDAYMGYSAKPPKAFPKGLPDDYQFDVGPKLEHMVPPVYPLEDLKAKRGGKVGLAYVVRPDGRVGEVQAVPGTASPSLVAAAVAAMEQFQFTPPGRKGKPCYAMLRIELEFSPDGNSGHSPVSDDTKRILHILEKSPDELAKPDALDQRPKLLRGRPPKISPANIARGKTLVEFVLDRNGIPQLPHVISADNPSLGYAACQVVTDWRFERPQSGGRYVDTLVQVPIEFK